MFMCNNSHLRTADETKIADTYDSRITDEKDLVDHVGISLLFCFSVVLHLLVCNSDFPDSGIFKLPLLQSYNLGNP